MALRGFLSCKTAIQRILLKHFLIKSPAQANISTSALPVAEKLCITSFSQKKLPIYFDRTSAPVLQTLITPINLPCVTDRVNFEYQLPTLPVKHLIVHQDLPVLIEKFDPLVNNKEIRIPNTQPIIKKEAAGMIQIRRRKMRKHKLKKLRKRMRFLWSRLKLRREKKIENAFKEEVYAQVREAESFDAEKYVKDILHRINNKPHVETPEERWAKIRELMKQNRSNVTFFRPDYKDIK